MDRELPKNEIYGQRLKTLITIIGILLILIASYYLLQKILKGKVDQSTIVIASVERGSMENRVTAMGKVVPYYERAINAPVSTEIKTILLRPGDKIEKGDLIMELDDEYTRLEYEQLKDELEVRSNNIIKLKLEYDKNLRDLDYRNSIQGLKVEQLTTQLKDQKRLKEIGGATEEDEEKAELDLKVAKLDKKILENELDYREKSNETEKRNLELELEIQKKKLKELDRKLRETLVKSPEDGVLTWVNEDLGKTLNAGDQIAKIADLDRFKIEASTSDRNVQILSIGIPVKVRVERTMVDGVISNILPAVENNTIRFNVTVDDKDANLLRSNMQVEVFIITDHKEDVLMVKNGSAFSGANTQDIFKVDGEHARKIKIQIGLRNSNFVEISGDIAVGDKLIISDTEDFDHRDEITIK